MPHERASMYATDMHLVETAIAEEDLLARQEDLSLSRQNIYQFKFSSKKTGPTI